MNTLKIIDTFLTNIDYSKKEIVNFLKPNNTYKNYTHNITSESLDFLLQKNQQKNLAYFLLEYYGEKNVIEKIINLLTLQKKKQVLKSIKKLIKEK